MLGYAFFSRTTESLATESETYIGGNDALLCTLIQSKTDGIVGTGLLIVGFALQWIGRLQVDQRLVGAGLYIVLLLALIAYFARLRRVLVRRQFEMAKRGRNLARKRKNSAGG